MTTARINLDWVPAWVRRRWLDEDENPAVLRLRRARVLAGAIQPPARRDPRLPGTAEAAMPPLSANLTLAPAASRPYAARPQNARGRISRAPLAGFSWGRPPRVRGARNAPHAGADHLLIWLASGQLRIDLPGRFHLLRPGYLAFIAAGTAFSLAPAPVEGEVLAIPAGVARKLGVQLPHDLTYGHIAAADLAPTLVAMDRLAEMIRPITPADCRAGAGSLARIAASLARLTDDFSQPKPPPDELKHARPLVDRYIALIRRDLEQGLTVSDFAQELGTSASLLDRAARLSRGRRALDILYDLRLERAITLLRGTALSTAEIAQSAGYDSISHMNRAFVAASGRGSDYFRQMPVQPPEMPGQESS